MIRNTILAICCTTLPAIAQAQSSTKDTFILHPGDFEAFSTGTTLYFTLNGTPYGSEQYLPGREVIWAFQDGTCQNGSWYIEGQALCFLYEGNEGPSCWHYLQKGNERVVRLIGAIDQNDLVIAGQDTRPLMCKGPEIGVRYEVEK